MLIESICYESPAVNYITFAETICLALYRRGLYRTRKRLLLPSQINSRFSSSVRRDLIRSRGSDLFLPFRDLEQFEFSSLTTESRG